MHYAKTQLLTDTFQYPTSRNQQRKSPSVVQDTKIRKHKEGTSPTTEATGQRPRLTEKQKKESRRKNESERRKKRRERGLCKYCPSGTTEGRTRCSHCAEKHRQYSEQRRRARGVQPRYRCDDTKLLELSQKDDAEQDAKAASRASGRVHSEAYKLKRRETQARTRIERISLGLCVGCGEPSLEGQTRCARCALKHRVSNRRAKAQKMVLRGVAKQGDDTNGTVQN